MSACTLKATMAEDLRRLLPFCSNHVKIIPDVIISFIKAGGDPDETYNHSLPYSLGVESGTMLYIAVSTENVQLTSFLLEANADPNKTTHANAHCCNRHCPQCPQDVNLARLYVGRETLLHFICRKNIYYIPDTVGFQIATLLLDYGADQLIKDDHGHIPLYYAFRKRKSSLVELLLKRLPKGANPYIIDGTNLSAFHIACAHGFDQIVRDLLQSGVQINHYVDVPLKRGKCRFTGFYLAVLENRKSTVELLLQQGADVNDMILIRKDLLFIACDVNAEKFFTSYESSCYEEFVDDELSCRNQLDIINLLLDHGVDINETDSDGLSPIHYCSCTYATGELDLWRERLTYSGYHSESKYQVESIRKRAILQHVLERGAAINTRSILHFLYNNFDIDIDKVKLLIKHGADVNVRDKQYCTPLHVIAVSYPKFYIQTNRPFENIELLLNCGADVNARNVVGMTPISQFVKMHYNCLPTYKPADDRGNIRETLRVLLVHVQRLLTLGLAVDAETRELLKERIYRGDFVSVEEECVDELTRMKQIQIDADTTLYRLLRVGLDGTGRCLDEPKLQAVMKNFKIAKEYPHYAGLLKRQIKRRHLLERAESAMNLIARYVLPHLCTEVIFRCLSNYDLGNLIEAGNTKSKLIDTAGTNVYEELPFIF